MSNRRTRARWLRRALTRAALGLVLAIVVAAVGVVGFIATRCYASAPAIGPVIPAPAGVNGYHRSEAFTFLTLPEWFIVFSADEYAAFVANRSPAGFPFVGSARQYWSYYGAVCDATRGVYPFETGYHVMLGVIGLSQTIEYAVKGAYEGTIGRVTDALFTHDTAEDRFAAGVAREYGAFMHTTPWYQFPFFARLASLWREVPLWGPHVPRKWERRVVLTAEYAFKGAYGWLMGLGTQAAYGAEDLATYARLRDAPPDAIAAAGGRPVEGTGGGVIALPRYEGFTPAALSLLRGGARFLDVAGNDTMLLTTVVPTEAQALELPSRAVAVARQPFPSDVARVRVAIAVPLEDLGEAVRRLALRGAIVEHLYDY